MSKDFKLPFIKEKREQFDRIIPYVLKSEGALSEDSRDPGGTTKYGISLRFLKTFNKSYKQSDIKNLTRLEAEEIYFEHFYLNPHLYLIKDIESQYLLLDQGINQGHMKAIKRLQSTLNFYTVTSKITRDGILGKKTTSLYNRIKKDHETTDHIVKKYISYSRNYYEYVGRRMKWALRGWLNRIRDIKENIKELKR